MRQLGALKVAMQELRRKTGLFERRFDLSSAEQLVAEGSVPSEKIVAEGAGSGKAVGFAEDIQYTVVVAEFGSFAAVPDLDNQCIEVGADLHQSQ